MTTPFERFAWPLRRAGFRKTWASRAGGERVHEWRREDPDGRTLVCQIGDSGNHRLSHEWVGCSDTRPTGFTDETGLAKAIERESTRSDSHYADPYSHHYMPARRYLLERRAGLTSARPDVAGAMKVEAVRKGKGAGSRCAASAS